MAMVDVDVYDEWLLLMMIDGMHHDNEDKIEIGSKQASKDALMPQWHYLNTKTTIGQRAQKRRHQDRSLLHLLLQRLLLCYRQTEQVHAGKLFALTTTL